MVGTNQPPPSRQLLTALIVNASELCFSIKSLVFLSATEWDMPAEVRLLLLAPNYFVLSLHRRGWGRHDASMLRSDVKTNIML